MIRNIILIIFSALMPLVSFASGTTASQALANAANRCRQAASVTYSFTAVDGGGNKADGTLTMAKEKFKMIGSGYGIWFNGTSLWSYSQQMGETTLTEPTQEELLETNPFYIISNYDKHFTATTVSNASGKYVVQLDSKSKNSAVKRAVITLDSSTWQPISIDLTFSNSATLRVTVKSVKESKQSPKASEFQYPAASYPGVDVVDLR